jgi:hypothetical protein
MENFLLRQKWVGFLTVITVSVLFAFYMAGKASDAYLDIEPSIAREAGYFLPITFEKGQIVSPRNTIIERTYGTPQNPYKVVLDTEVDDLNVAELSTGIYFTRNKVYSYDATKGETKIQSMEKFPDAKLTRQDLTDFMEKIGKYLNPTLFFVIFTFVAVYIGLMALFGTVIMHWLFKKLYNADFALTLRVNVLAFVALFVISAFLNVYFGLIVTLLIMIACNYLANIMLENKKA